MLDETKTSIRLAGKCGERAGKNMADEHRYADAYELERIASNRNPGPRIARLPRKYLDK